MAKLTAMQRAMLSNVAARDDGAAVAPAKFSRAASMKTGASLIARKLMREIQSKPGMPVWRKDKGGKSFSLVITWAGREAIGDGGAENVDAPVSKTSNVNQRSAAHSADAIAPCAGTKRALIIEMLSTEQGVTLDALIDATGWLPHTTRAALTGLRKSGFVIERMADRGKGASAYRVVSAVNRAA
jgi:hypothetical protein